MTDVLILCEYPTLCGGERSILSVAERLRDRGWGVRFLAPDRGPLAEELRRLGFSLVSWIDRDENGVVFPQGERREILAATLREQRPGLLHANSLSMTRLAAPVAKQMGIPFLGHIRDIYRLSARAIADVNHATRIACVSDATRAFHLQQKLDESIARVCYNGVDPALFVRKEPNGRLRSEWGVSADRPLVGCVGQIILRKGHDTFAEAAALLKERHPRPFFFVVGTQASANAAAAEHEQKIRDTFAAAGLADDYLLSGPRDDIPALLNEIDLLVHPARQEPLGRVLLEAATSETPVVATDVGGTREILPDESFARIVPPDDAAMLAVAISDSLDDRTSAKHRAARAKKRADELFTAEIATDRLSALYQETLIAGE